MEATLDMKADELGYCKGFFAKVLGLIIKFEKRSKNFIKASAFDYLRLRSLLQFMGLNEERKNGFLMACNGHFFKGVFKFVFGK